MKFYEKILYLKIKYLCIEIQWTKNLNSQIITENTNISLILIISKLIELKIIFTNIVSNSNKIYWNFIRIKIIHSTLNYILHFSIIYCIYILFL